MSTEGNIVVDPMSQAARERILKQKGVTVWFTGLSGSGKSTTAFTLERLLVEKGLFTRVLDGDVVRHGMNSDLGFSAQDRSENIRRIGEVAKLFSEVGIVTIVSFISPYHHDRRMVRSIHEAAQLDFLEVFSDTPLSVCEERDPKGYYKQARAGLIPHFTGINDPYEPPQEPDAVIKSAEMSPQDCAQTLLAELLSRGIIS